MPFTENSDLYGAVNEEAINRVLTHIMRQRPSLFNYATKYFTERRDLLCRPIPVDPNVRNADDPYFSEVDALPVLKAPRPVHLDWCFQLTEAAIDFHARDEINLPPEIESLPEQRFALRFAGCFGMGCLDPVHYSDLVPLEEAAAVREQKTVLETGDTEARASGEPRARVTSRVDELDCFCMEITAMLHFEWGDVLDENYLKIRLDAFEITDLPEGMEAIVECYVESLLRLSILPRLIFSIETMTLDITKTLQPQETSGDGKQISLQPTPAPDRVPHNPAVEDDQLKVFINMVVEEE